MLSWLASVRVGLLILILLAILPAVGLTLYSAGERRQQDGAEAQQEALTLIRLASAEQGQLIAETRNLLVFLARQPEVQTGDPATCSKYLATVLEEYPLYIAIGVADLNGDLYCSTLPSPERVNLATVPHFQGALQSHEFAIGDYQIGRVTSKAILPFGRPVFDPEGNLKGVVVAGLDLNWLNEFVSHTNLPPGATLTVADMDGTVLARHPDPGAWIGQSIEELPLFQQMSAAEREGAGEGLGLDGAEKLYAFTRLGEPDRSGEVYVSIGIPEAVAYGPADQALNQHLMGLGVALILTLGIAWFGTDLLMMRRVRALVTSTQKLAAGDFKSRSGLKGRGGEFGLLAGAFDHMAQELEEREEERVERVREQTRRVEAEAARERISSILESINDAFFAVDCDWRFTYLNSNAGQVMQQLTGKTGEELIGQDMWEELSQFLGSRFYEEYHRAVSQQVSVQFEEFCPQLKVWLEVHAHPGPDGLSIFFQDVTERKQTEEALRESEERLRLATSAGKVGVWDWNTITNTVTWSETHYRIHGMEPGTFGGTVEAFAELIHVDDRDYVNQAIQRALHEDTPYELEFRAVRPDGGIVWIFTHAVVMRDTLGKPVRMLGGTVDITERKRVEEALRQSEAELTDFIETATLGLHRVGPDGIIQWANRAELQMLGYEPDEYIGHHISEFHANQTVIEDIMQRLSRGETLQNYEARMRAKDGSLRHVLIDSTALWENGKFKHSRCFTRDETERKRAEAQAQQESRLTAVLNRVGATVVSELDLQHVVQKVTDEATDLTGAQFGAFFYNVQNEEGESYMLHTLSGAPREAFAQLPQPRSTALFAPTFRGEGIIRLDDVTQDPRYGLMPPYHGMPPGHLPVHSYLAAPVLSRNGEVLGGLFFGHQQTGQFTEYHENVLSGIISWAAIAIENAQLYTARQHAEAALREADRRKDQFLAMLSHELRNPLAPIANAVELLRRRPDDASIQQVALSALDSQVGTLTRLVDDLLDVSRVTTGRIQLQETDVDLNSMVRSVAESFQRQMAERQHQFSISLPDTRLWVRGDPIRLEQVVVNLLSNAAKYTPKGGQVQLTVMDKGSEALIRVKDSGIGIEGELLPYIFEMFSQGDRTLDRAQSGLGIGLSLVKSLVELHGGRVTAKSEGQSKGSEFVVHLPTVPPPVAGSLTLLEDSASPATGPLRVLLVDDVADTRKLFGRLLESYGHQVRTAHDGPTAIEAALEFQPDVVLLDIGLPRMDGYEVARRMRQEPALQHVTLIAVTGYGQQTDRRHSREAGFDHHLVKPPDIDALQQIFGAIVGSRAS